MLFIHKESGEIVEVMVKTLGDPVGDFLNQPCFPIGSIAVFGNIKEEQQMSSGVVDYFSSNFIFLGFL